MDIEQYIARHIDAEPDHLHRLYRHTYLTHLYPRMCSGHVQGRVLRMFVAMISPLRAVELGTYTGYSTLCIAEGMPSGGILDTVEIDDEKRPELLQTFADHCPDGVEIRLHTGDALDVMPGLQGGWQLAFVDANKRHYAEYLRMLLPMMAPGAFIIADNTLWDGHVTDDGAHDPQTDGIRLFNDIVAADTSLRKVILPLRDGLTIIQKTM